MAHMCHRPQTRAFDHMETGTSVAWTFFPELMSVVSEVDFYVDFNSEIAVGTFRPKRYESLTNVLASSCKHIKQFDEHDTMFSYEAEALGNQRYKVKHGFDGVSAL